MSGPGLHTVAILAASPALSSVLGAVLAGSVRLRVRCFETEAALLAYAAIAPIDLAVLDFDCPDAPAGRLAPRLRRMPGHARLEIVALGRRLPPGIGELARIAGIDEVVVKPMSPRLLLERVLARLAAREPEAALGLPSGGDWARYGDNVVALFGHGPELRP